jgi:integrase
MPGRQAKFITPYMLKRMLRYAGRSPFPVRARAVVMLSVKAGLRACEIAKLDWSMVLDATGSVGNTLVVVNAIAKRRSGRRIPIHPALKASLQRLLSVSDPAGPVVRSARGGHMRPNSIVNWFVKMFATLDYEGCSSHSGRRTFITRAARNLHRVGCSLRDVQMLAGHRSIQTTQGYIDGDSSGQRRLVGML